VSILYLAYKFKDWRSTETFYLAARQLELARADNLRVFKCSVSDEPHIILAAWPTSGVERNRRKSFGTCVLLPDSVVQNLMHRMERGVAE
jgi:hypothetical protein